MTGEEETDESSEEARQSQSPTPTQDSPLSSSKREPNTRILQDLYEVTDDIPLLCLYANCEPLVFEEAMKSKKWRQAMEEEIKSIEKNDTWELTTLSKGQKDIRVKWVYKAKKAKGEVEKYKARLVAKGNSQSMIVELKKSMMREFEMTDIGHMSYYLGIKVKQTNEEIFIRQERYAIEILKRFGMDKCNPVGTPIKHKIMVCFIQQVRTLSWLDIAIVTGQKQDDGRSTSGFLFFLGNNAFTWSSKKQPIVTLSSCEAEYIAATSCVCHAIWLRSMPNELHMEQEDTTEIYVDNKSARKNHDRSKHINIRYHFIRECIAKKDVRVIHTSFEDQVADNSPSHSTSEISQDKRSCLESGNQV
nr:retrovirus-related Pol polyprotein from transposon TNT 1-94 [Tanacetum cinerariifolium]